MKTFFSICILSFVLCACPATKKGAKTDDQATKPNPDAKYKVLKKIPIPGDGGWDYCAFDTVNRRLFISHSTKVDVLDVDKEQVVGEIPNTPGVHGIAFNYELNRGYTSNGNDSSVTIFDLKTLKPIKTVKVSGGNPDCILYDQFSKRVFTFNGKSNNATALNAETGAIDGTAELGGKPEFCVTNGYGNVYINLEDKNEMIFMNPKTLAIGYRIPLDSVDGPSAMAYDLTYRHLFIGGSNALMIVLNGDNGGKNCIRKIGEGVDAMAYNYDTRLIFAANGEGNISVIHQIDRDHYKKLDSIPTQKGARTLAIDMRKDRIYLPVADFGPPAKAEPGKKERPSIVPGSFGILVVGKE